MENIWKLIEKALDIDELHDTASKAQSELHDLKDQVEEAQKQNGGYVPKEYPKMLPDGKTVWNEAEEEAVNGVAPADPAPTEASHE